MKKEANKNSGLWISFVVIIESLLFVGMLFFLEQIKLFSDSFIVYFFVPLVLFICILSLTLRLLKKRNIYIEFNKEDNHIEQNKFLD